MGQHYPDPIDVCTPPKFWPTAYGVRKMKEIIAKDGLIVPILVTIDFTREGPVYVVADCHQAERLAACIDLNFETVLIETEWTEEDL